LSAVDKVDIVTAVAKNTEMKAKKYRKIMPSHPWRLQHFTQKIDMDKWES